VENRGFATQYQELDNAMKCRILPLLSKQSFTRLINRDKVSPIPTTECEDTDILQLYSISVVSRRPVQAEEARRIR